MDTFGNSLRDLKLNVAHLGNDYNVTHPEILQLT